VLAPVLGHVADQVRRLNSANRVAAKMLRLPTWSSPQVISCQGWVIIA